MTPIRKNRQTQDGNHVRMILLTSSYKKIGRPKIADKARQGTDKADTTRPDKARQGQTRPDKARQGQTRPDKRRQGFARRNMRKPRQGQTRPDKHRQGQTSRQQTSAHKAAHDETLLGPFDDGGNTVTASPSRSPNVSVAPLLILIFPIRW